jgi:hypothetical protein
MIPQLNESANKTPIFPIERDMVCFPLAGVWDCCKLYQLNRTTPSPCRKLNPDILVMKSAEQWRRHNTTNGMDSARLYINNGHRRQRSQRQRFV